MHNGGVHLVVLAPLQRILRIEKGLGSSLPPVELERRDSTLLRKYNTYFLLRQRKVLKKSCEFVRRWV